MIKGSVPAPGGTYSLGRHEVARVGYGGPAWRAWLAGPAVSVRVRDDRVLIRLRIVANSSTLQPASTSRGEI